MFYQSDFRTLPARFQPPRYDYRRSLKQLRKSEVDLNGKSEENDEKVQVDEKPLTALQTWFLDFCGNTSLHGMKFIGQTTLHWTER